MDGVQRCGQINHKASPPIPRPQRQPLQHGQGRRQIRRRSGVGVHRATGNPRAGHVDHSSPREYPPPGPIFSLLPCESISPFSVLWPAPPFPGPAAPSSTSFRSPRMFGWGKLRGRALWNLRMCSRFPRQSIKESTASCSGWWPPRSSGIPLLLRALTGIGGSSRTTAKSMLGASPAARWRCTPA